MTNSQLNRSIEIKNTAIEAVQTGSGINEAYELFLTDELAAEVTLTEFVEYFSKMIERRGQMAAAANAHYLAV